MPFCCSCPLRDHPRVGGGTLGRRQQARGLPGPSPRGRGNRHRRIQQRRRVGTIPAWAGEPNDTSVAAICRGDHPRVGGGTYKRAKLFVSLRGPSPRGRGNRFGMPIHDPLSGTIPAWAGEPGHIHPLSRVERDHPRVGGGTGNDLLWRRCGRGPSPRGRGNHRRRGHKRVLAGTIPAWAGEPRSEGYRGSASGDHPRVGGGTENETSPTCPTWGPSPRGRGNPKKHPLVASIIGTIPAWAGEPPTTCSTGPLGGDHPRVGGGTDVWPVYICQIQGPSPRGRGNHRPQKPRRPGAGTIPAWAGEPRAGKIFLVRDRDHPRVGGGTSTKWFSRFIGWGPSPRGRGNLSLNTAMGTTNRTIPAWAGEPFTIRTLICSGGDHPRVGGGTSVTA